MSKAKQCALANIQVKEVISKKRLYRIVDFKQKKFDAPATVIAIEYDPNRGPRVALIEYADKTRAYILCPQGLNVGDVVMSSDKAIEAKTANRMKLEHIPVGLFVYSIEMTPGKGGQLVRGAGLSAQFTGVKVITLNCVCLLVKLAWYQKLVTQVLV